MTDLPRRFNESLPVTAEEASRVREYAEAAMPPNTRRVYQTAIRQWQAWTADRGVPALPAEPAHLALYLTERGPSWAPRTLAVHLAAIRWWHRRSRQPNPLADPDLELVIRGIRRTHGRPVEQARPIRMHELALMLRSLHPSRLRDVRDRALLLIGWWGALRRSELSALRPDDVIEENEGLRLTIRRSKTDQEGESYALALAKDPSGDLCPLAAWASWIGHRHRNIPDDDGSWAFAFTPVARGEHVQPAGLSGRSISRVIGERADAVGLTGMSGHSLRAGFITEAAARGIPEWQIMAHSRHKSAAVVRVYIRTGALWTDALTRRMMR